MRKIIRGIINDKKYTLSDIGLDNISINQIMTIMDEEAMFPKFNPHTGARVEVNRDNLDNLILIHQTTVFFEDRGHDWYIFGDYFKFGAHSSAPGDVVDVLVDYSTI